MLEGAQLLLGKHDFTSFRDSECQAKTPVKTLDLLAVTRAGDEVQIEARARSFLHHQVRNMVGSLKLVGAGKWRAQRIGEALAARDRRAGGPTAPPEGLYLVEVIYPE
jgi:tRNA pseudouridine38-40 synthase